MSDLAFNEWADKIEENAKKLNRSPAARVFEVGASGTLLGGDIHLSKGDDDEFELTIENVKAGIWAFEGEPEAEVVMQWVSAGSLDFANLPMPAPQPVDEDAEWEPIGTFSVDSGAAGVFDLDALEKHFQHGFERGSVLEILAEADEDNGNIRGVPSGIVVSGNDGGYSFQGIKDEEGFLVAIKLDLA